MNPLSIIPPQFQLLARVVALLLIFVAGAATAWKVKDWKDGSAIADLKTQHALAVADAAGRSQAQLKAAVAARDAKAAALALIDQSNNEALRRFNRENDSVRADIAAGTRLVRVAAACPGSGNDLPRAGAGGRVDPGPSAVLDPAAGQTVLDLRARVGATEITLGACQQALGCVTGQGACPAAGATP
jgi:prophage endopeptidase